MLFYKTEFSALSVSRWGALAFNRKKWATSAVTRVQENNGLKKSSVH